MLITQYRADRNKPVRWNASTPRWTVTWSTFSTDR